MRREKPSDLKAKIANWDETISEMAEMLEDSAPVDVPVNRADAPSSGNKGRFANFGEQLIAVYNAAQPNRPVIDERLLNSASGANEVCRLTEASLYRRILQPNF